MATPRLNNLTIYVSQDEFAANCEFYAAIFGDALFRGSDIMCFAAGAERAVCVHIEGELGRVSGEVEAIYWVDDLEAFRSDATERGLRLEDTGVGLQLVDPSGRRLRFISPPSET